MRPEAQGRRTHALCATYVSDAGRHAAVIICARALNSATLNMSRYYSPLGIGSSLGLPNRVYLLQDAAISRTGNSPHMVGRLLYYHSNNNRVRHRAPLCRAMGS